MHRQIRKSILSFAKISCIQRVWVNSNKWHRISCCHPWCRPRWFAIYMWLTFNYSVGVRCTCVESAKALIVSFMHRCTRSHSIVFCAIRSVIHGRRQHTTREWVKKLSDKTDSERDSEQVEQALSVSSHRHVHRAFLCQIKKKKKQMNKTCALRKWQWTNVMCVVCCAIYATHTIAIHCGTRQ